VSDVTEWLEANAETRARLFSQPGLEPRVVHLVAVLVLAGLDDEQIDAQLFGHGISVNGQPKCRARLPRALKVIRRLAA